MEKIIVEAMKAKRLLSFAYKGYPRIVEPHVYGVTDGIEQLLGYQVRGGSSQGDIPNWRRFALRDISQLQVLAETFPGRRPASTGQHSKWDREILIVD